MKKFVRFDWDQYYPGGGLGDVSGSYDTLEEAIAANPSRYMDYAYVVDRDTWEIVWDKDDAESAEANPPR